MTTTEFIFSSFSCSTIPSSSSSLGMPISPSIMTSSMLKSPKGKPEGCPVRRRFSNSLASRPSTSKPIPGMAAADVFSEYGRMQVTRGDVRCYD